MLLKKCKVVDFTLNSYIYKEVFVRTHKNSTNNNFCKEQCKYFGTYFCNINHGRCIKYILHRDFKTIDFKTIDFKDLNYRYLLSQNIDPYIK